MYQKSFGNVLIKTVNLEVFYFERSTFLYFK